MTRKPFITAILVAWGLVVMAGCGSGTSDTDTENSAVGKSSVRLPKEYQGRALKVSVIDNYPPLGFRDGNHIAGLDYDLSVAIGKKLGVKLNITLNASEDGQLGVQNGRFDWTGASSITAERLDVVDMTSYMQTGDAMVVPADAPDVAPKWTAVCGMTLGTLAGATENNRIEAHQTDCTSAGKPKIDVRTFPKITDAQLATTSGRVDAWYAGRIAAGWAEKSSPDTWKVTGPQGAPLYESGFMTRKDSGLAQPLADAVNELIADGTYADIMDKWVLPSLRITKSRVNPAPLPVG